MHSFSYLEPVCCYMSSSNSCFLTCKQISQDVGQVVWYSHLFQNFPQFIVIHTVKGFSIVNKAEIDVFLELSCFFNESSGSWQFGLKPAWTSLWYKWLNVNSDLLLLGTRLRNGPTAPVLSCCCCCLFVKSHLTLCDAMGCSPPGSSVHQIIQARILEWVVISFSKGSS